MERDGEIVRFAINGDTPSRAVDILVSGDGIESGALYWINQSDHPPRLINADSEGVIHWQLPWAINTNVSVESAAEPLLFERFDESKKLPATWAAIIDDSNIRPVLRHGHENFEAEKGRVPTEGESIEVAVAEGVGRESANAVRVDKAAVGGHAELVSGLVDVDAGTTYLGDVFYTVESLTFGGNATFGVELTDDSGTFKRYVGYGSMSPVQRNRDGQWRRAFTRFTPQPGETKARLRMGVGGSPVVVLWDDARIAVAPTKLMRMPSELPGDQGAAKLTEAEVRQMLEEAEPLSAEVKLINGQPTTHVNGRPIGNFHFNAGFYAWNSNQPQLHGLFADAGVRVHTVPITLGDPLNYGEALEDAVWQGPGKVNFKPIEKRIITLLRHSPDAMIRLNLGPEPYYGFHEDHPDAVFRSSDGRIVKGTAHNASLFDPADVEENEIVSPSYASETYRELTGDVIEQVGRYLAENDVGKRVIGIHLIGGHDGQWLPHTSQSSDFGKEHVDAFRNYLRTIYDSDQALQEAYADAEVTLNNVMPVADEAYGVDHAFLDPAVGSDRHLMDTFRFTQVGKVDTIEHLIEAFDRGFGRPALNSTYWSDVYHGHGLDHWATQQLLEVEAVDAIATIGDYRNWRRQGRPGAVSSAAGSLRLHNKLYLGEVDHRTPHSWGRADAVEDQDWLGQIVDPLDTLHASRREWGQAFSLGGGGWHYSLSGQGQGFEPFIQGIHEAAELADHLASSPSIASDHPPIAVFLDERTIEAMSHENLAGLMTLQVSGNSARDPLSTSGVGYDPYLLGDLDHPDRSLDYPITIILGGVTITPEQVTWVEENLQQDGRIVVVMHAAGQTYAGGVSETAKRLTGIDVELTADEQVVYRLRAEGDDPLAEQIDYHLTETTGPKIVVTDAEATPIGTYLQTGETAAAVRRHDDWTGVYIAAPGALTPRLLRNLAVEAGVEPSGPEGDLVMAGNGVIVVHGMTKNPVKTLRWNDPCDLVDIASGEIVATDATSVSVEVPLGETRWFYKK